MIGTITGAAYIRVSTDGQLDYSPESQRDEIIKYAKAHDIYLAKEYIFIEQEGVSGKKAGNRDEFQRMIATAKLKPKPFDVILVWKFSRFARNQDESTFYKGMLRKKLGIDVISISEPIMDGMYGRLIEMIIEWQDEFYSYNLGVEVKRGMKKKAELGLYNGKVPLGYHKEPKSMPAIYEPEAVIVRTMFEKYTAGMDRNAIVRYVNDKGFRTRSGKKFDAEGVLYILENPFYIGKVRWNRRTSSGTSTLKMESDWIITDAHHPALIDTDTWDAVQNRIKEARAIHAKYSHPVSHTKHWLSGMVKCSICGKSLSIKTGRNGATNQFQCLGYRAGLHAESQSISERKLIAAVFDSLRSVLQSGNANFEIIHTNSPGNDSELFLYRTELEKISQKEKRIRQAYMDGIDTLEEYKENKVYLSEKRNEVESRINFLSEKENSSETNPKQLLLDNVSNVIDILESDAPYEVKGTALRSIVKQIVFYKETKTLKFVYYITQST